MSDDNCNVLIGLWGVGDGINGGTCNEDSFGYLIGASGYKYAVLELHWNNPSQVSTYTDSSGMILYYTAKLRPNSGAVLTVGQLSLDIPPGQSAVGVSGMCSTYCTSALPRPLYIVGADLHMHLLGRSGDILLYRNGLLNATLISTTSYDYNMPEDTRFSPPILLLPGDEIRVHCVYNSQRKNVATHYGEAVTDEMCFGFLTYYPLTTNFSECTQFRSADVCSNVPLKCAIGQFQSLSNTADEVCDVSSCSSDCLNVMTALVNTGCMTGDVGAWNTVEDPAELAWLLQMAKVCKVGTSTASTTPPLASLYLALLAFWKIFAQSVELSLNTVT